MTIFALLLLQCFIFKFPTITAQTFERNLEQTMLDKLLSPPYDKNIRPAAHPSNDSDATQVYVNIFLRAISKIDDFNMEYSVQMTLREEWYDGRLRFDHLLAKENVTGNLLKFVTVTDTKSVWMPDIFFINEKKGELHNLIVPNSYVRIFPDGHVLYSVRISLLLACPMKLSFFPLDNQICSIFMASYGLTSADLNFHWREEEPVQIEKLSLPRFTLSGVESDICDRRTTTGAYPTLAAHLLLRRNYSYYMTQLYIPCIMLVLVSQISFYIDENAVPARTALGITTLLTMSTQTASIQKSLPPVSYVKSVDLWSGTCLIFVFGALLEYAFVNYAARRDRRMKKDWESRGERPVPSGSDGWLARRYPLRSKRIDIVSRIVFPIAFAIFNIIYWSVCLALGSEDLQPECPP